MKLRAESLASPEIIGRCLSNDIQEEAQMDPNKKFVLVTGANSGLGLAICKRLIDDFIATQDATAQLTISFTTRSPRKSSETLKSLEAHLAKCEPNKHDRRIALRPESLELTSLISIRALARKLLLSDLPYLNAIILNAGIGAWGGLDWPLATWTVLKNIRQATTWPEFKLGVVGLIAKPQLNDNKDHSKAIEPPLGEVFCANLFGHYMLAHWLMPLLWSCPPGSPGKTIWIGSVEACARHYNPEDHQGLLTNAPYEHSKRLSDYLALTSHNQPATAKFVKAYLTPSAHLPSRTNDNNSQPPRIYVTQPGICTTTIIDLYWIVFQAYTLAIYLTRLLGGPWSTFSSYAGAKSATWVALASSEELKQREAVEGGGAGKWGSGITRFGVVSVQRTEVEGYGINGNGKPFKDKWWAGSLGRVSGAKDATEEDVKRFITEGADVWEKMEALRVDWEERIEKQMSTYEGK